jgi:hypothetical protein
LLHATWNDIKIQYGYDITVPKFVALCEWKKLKYQKMSEPSFQELSTALADDYEVACNNPSLMTRLEHSSNVMSLASLKRCLSSGCNAKSLASRPALKMMV